MSNTNNIRIFEPNGSYSAPNQTGTPERNLLMAILERSILDYVGNSQIEINEAHNWLFGENSDDENRLFSFAWICEQLDLNYKSVSKIIKEMPKRGNRKMAPWYFPEYKKAS